MVIGGPLYRLIVDVVRPVLGPGILGRRGWRPHLIATDLGDFSCDIAQTVPANAAVALNLVSLPGENPRRAF